MTKILAQRQEQLTSILNVWNNLDDETKRKSINLVSPFIQSSALIAEITSSQNLQSELAIFAENYGRIFATESGPKDIKIMGQSDFSAMTMQGLIAMREADKEGSNTDEQRKILESKLQKIGLTTIELRNRIINEGDHKYQHAATRNSFNYPKLINEVFRKKGLPALTSYKSELMEYEDENQFFAKLVEINTVAALSDNFSIAKAAFGIDGMEEHDLINQASKHRQLLDSAAQIALIEKTAGTNFAEKVGNFFTDFSQLKSAKVVTLENKTNSSGSTPLFDPRATKEIAQKAEQQYQTSGNQIKLTVGYEEEHLLLPIGGPRAEEERAALRNDFEKVKRFSADLDSRKNMRANYHYHHDYIGNTPNPLLLFSEEELENFEQQNSGHKTEIRQKVKDFFNDQKNSGTYSEEEERLFDSAISNINLLNDEELYFLDMMFLRYDSAVEHRLELDGVFNHRESLADNFKKILPDIANKASFYHKTLDMIRATEIAMGEFAIDGNSIAKKDAAIAYTRNVAAEHGIRAKDRDVQINIGATFNNESILAIGVRENIGRKEVVISPAYLKFAKAMQEALVETIEENPYIIREGQKSVSFAIDRKKGGLKSELENSPYYKVAALEDEYGSAFPTHRDNTGKAGMLRGAAINSEIGVIELRLIGNNTHVPDFDEYVRPIFNGIDVLPEIFLPKLLQKVAALEIKASDLEKNIVVKHNGSVAGIEAINLEQPTSDRFENSILSQIKTKPYKAAVENRPTKYPQSTVFSTLQENLGKSI